MDAKELERIIENHRHWLDKDVDGWKTMRADLREANLEGADLGFTNLSGADLRCANLRGADLEGANLRGANLYGANLYEANLYEASLSKANLRSANLGYADLRYANLRRATLRYANLRYANLRGANLRVADLSEADLRVANLRGVDLCGADLSGADLREADLYEADLRGATLLKAKNVPYIPMICPEEGEFIGYKKACGKIVKLLIPEDAKRSSATTRKCRCNKAKVLGIYELDGSISEYTEVPSNRDSNFIYKINKEIIVDDFDENRWNECSTGIHFFMQRYEAVEYQS